MLPNPYAQGRRIILFGRYPVPGRTKTRLIPLLGPLGAADFQARMTQQCLATLIRARAAPITFCYTGARLGQVKRWLADYPIELRPQVPGDLGRRMLAAIRTACDQAPGPVLLMGSDIPAMTADHIERAFAALTDHDLVLGPSLDGGYWLVGCRRPVDIFASIAWGGFLVLAQTLAAARRLGLKVCQLEPLSDIDTPQDLLAWQPDWNRTTPYLSVVIPTLNEADRIAAAVEQVQAPDVQVLVVDGGSRDDTVAAARRAGAAVICAPRGRAVQQNRGAAEASGRVLLFLHADTRLPDDYSRCIFDCLLDRRTIAGAFRFKTDLDHWAMALIEKGAHLRGTLFHLPYGDQALFMRSQAFTRAGGFAPTPIAEDLMLIRRLARSGKIRVLPVSAVTSARRWQVRGILRTTVINYLVAAGCLLNIAPARLASLYHGKKTERDI